MIHSEFGSTWTQSDRIMLSKQTRAHRSSGVGYCCRANPRKRTDSVGPKHGEKGLLVELAVYEIRARDP
jgi:hypothetical protein